MSGGGEPSAELVEVAARAIFTTGRLNLGDASFDEYVRRCGVDNNARGFAAVALRAAHDAGLIVYRDELEGRDVWLRASMEHGGAPIVVDAQAVNANDAVIEDMVEWPKDERR